MESNKLSEIMFGVPCIVADNLLKLASGESIKVLLYILRNSGNNIISEEISSNTGVSVQEVEDSIAFWKQLNVLPLENNSYNMQNQNLFININNQNTENDSSKEQKQQNTSDFKPPSHKKAFYRASEIAQIKQENKDIRELFNAMEEMMINPNVTMQNTLIYIHDYLGLDCAVIMTLIGYCQSIDKLIPGYIEEIARSWSKIGICNISDADKEVARLMANHEYTQKIVRIIGTNYKLTPSQKEIIDSWEKTGFSMDIIEYAYNITVENINKFSMNYMNKIITSWIEKGVKTFEEAQKLNSEHKKNFRTKYDNSDGFKDEEYEIVINNF